MLARLAAAIDEEPAIGEPHVLVSWELGRDGRKRDAACVLFDADGRALARSRALWIELRAGVGSPAVAATHFRTCPFCEATCGLEVTLEGTRRRGGPRRLRGRLQPRLHLPQGDRPQAPARGRRPADARRSSSSPTAASRRPRWDEAFARDRRAPLPHPRRARPRRRRRLRGQPERAQPVGAHLRAGVDARARARKSIFTASTVDQMPKHVSAGLMFGAPLSIPVPDVDRTDHLLILGANPLVSNGSLLTAPDMRGRLRAIRERGRQGRGDRPAPHPHRRGRRRAPLHPPRRRRPPAARASSTRSSTRAWPTRARSPST